MALVLKTEMVSDYLNTKLAVKDGVLTTVEVDGEVHLDIMTYPAQENFENGAILALVKKPFINFAISCGGAGAMTKEMIIEKYGDSIPEVLAQTIADDFGKAYGNYVIIPESMTLAITAAPITSIFNLLIKEDKTVEEVITD